MNWVKANKFLTGFIVVMLIGIGVLGYEVMAASGAYDESLNAYTSKAAEYNRLRHLIPFPNKANLEKYEEQKKSAKEVITAFQVDLAKDEFPLVPMTPEKFQDLLKETVVNVKKRAADAGVHLPDKFFLGFDKYETTPPSPEAAAPLGRQLKAIEWVVNQYIDNGVQDVGSPERVDLPEEKGGRNDRRGGEARGGEAQAGGPKGGGSGKGGGGKGGGGRAGRDLVQYHYFDISTICKQIDLAKILNAMSGPKAPQFYVLRQIRIKNTNEKGPPKATPGADAKPGTVDFIVGSESIKVDARFDIVDFNAPTDASSEPANATTPSGKQP